MTMAASAARTRWAVWARLGAAEGAVWSVVIVGSPAAETGSARPTQTKTPTACGRLTAGRFSASVASRIGEALRGARMEASPEHPAAGLEAIFAEMRPALVRRAAAMGAAGDAEDVVQDVWLKLRGVDAPVA
eukprot:gene6843-9239_t